jgi:hypothetical protein
MYPPTEKLAQYCGTHVETDSGMSFEVMSVDRVTPIEPVEMGFDAVPMDSGQVAWCLVQPRPMLFGEDCLGRNPDASRMYLMFVNGCADSLQSAFASAAFAVKHWARWVR